MVGIGTLIMLGIVVGSICFSIYWFLDERYVDITGESDDIITVGGVEFSLLFGGVVIIENIFMLPGVGEMALIGIVIRDHPLLLASVLSVAVVVLTVNLIVDILGAWLDPRRVHTAGDS